MKNTRFKFRIIIEKDYKTINGTCKGQIIHYCNGFIQTKLRTYFFGKNKRLSFLNSQIKAINQSTGLKDKNGKLIYEGDIVRFYSLYGHATFEIKWNEEFATFGYEDNETDFSEFGRLYDEAAFVEVIGNIYENKELLESEG